METCAFYGHEDDDVRIESNRDHRFSSRWTEKPKLTIL